MRTISSALNVARKPLCTAILGGIVAISMAPIVTATGSDANPWATAKSYMVAASCNPCAKAACGACNPCAIKKAACGACNPCAVKKAACGACNPCAVKKAACGACNPCAVKKAACGACNPCAVKKSACSPCKAASACNPCAAPKGGMGQKITLSGVLVDTRCYSFDTRNTVNEHYMAGGAKVKGCATACAQMGIPVALLEGGMKGGSLFTLAAPAPLLAPYMAEEARISGTEVSPGVVYPTLLEVKSGGTWKKVTAKGML